MWKLDRDNPGLAVSSLTHVAVLAASLVAFTSAPVYPEAQESIPVEVITSNQFSQITKGEKTAKEALPTPKPRAERISEVVEQRDPGDAKTDTPAPPKRPDIALAEEDAAIKAQEAAKEAARKAEANAQKQAEEAAKAKAEAQSKAEAQAKAAQAKAEAQAKAAQARAEALAKAERAEAESAAREIAAAKARAESEAKARAAEVARAKAAAEASAKAEARAAAEAKAQAAADAKAKAAEAKARAEAALADKFDAGDIRKLLQSKEPSQSSGSTAREVQRTASLGTATGNAQRLNPSQRDALIGLLQEQLHACWSVPVALQSAPKPPVPSVRIRLNPDGSLAGEPAVINSSSDPLFQTAAESATRAARRCAPLRIPAQFGPYYQDWKDLVVNFNLKDLG